MATADPLDFHKRSEEKAVASPAKSSRLAFRLDDKTQTKLAIVAARDDTTTSEIIRTLIAIGLIAFAEDDKCMDAVFRLIDELPL